jgi:hypothetical protein
MTCRKRIDDDETGEKSLPRDESGGCLIAARTASGMKAACLWVWLVHGTWEPVAPMPREKLKWDAPMRARVLMRGTGTEQLAVGMKAL